MFCGYIAGTQVLARWARKFKKVQAKKKSWNQINQNFFSWNCISGIFKTFSQFKNWFLVIFESAKNEIWPKNFFVKLIYLISRFFLSWTFLIFWPTVYWPLLLEPNRHYLAKHHWLHWSFSKQKIRQWQIHLLLVLPSNWKE